ncbi:Uncharacterized protein APZ42_031259 [Daphnia magna]|uniref:Uncharacterized protein n=1 Tax=Daphnia magna TaxID=35525 RepID=A0A164N076_9CRUS|nr:Uncharacterized protein APZ42_031259 [Daphnia magna]
MFITIEEMKLNTQVKKKYVMFVPPPVLNKPSTFQYAVFACRRHICVMPWLTNVEKMT